MGGGILPIAYHKGNIYFLFSRESFINKSQSGLWSDFGGSKENYESHYQTAIREGVEESNGILGNKTNIKFLIKHHCIGKISDRGYSIYLIQVKYDTTIIKNFSDHFNKVLKNRPKLVTADNGLYEKDKIKWIKLQDLKKHIEIFRPWYKKFVFKIIKFFE